MAMYLVRVGVKSFVARLERQTPAWTARVSTVISASMCTNVHYKFNRIVKCLSAHTQHSSMLPCGTSGTLRLQRYYSKRYERREQLDSDGEDDSNTECKGLAKSMFWRRKLRTVHNILDVDKDGLISYNDFLMFADRFKSLGHLDERHADEFTRIIKLTWEKQWGAVDRYNLVTVEQYLDEMDRLLEDNRLRKETHRWLPYLFKAIDADKSGYISVKEFKLYFKCLGLSEEHAAVAFAVIDTNSDGKLSREEFVKLGEEFFTTQDESRVCNMFWGPLVQ